MSTLQKAFTIVETVVARQPTGMTFAEVVAATKTPKASAHRILKELVAMGVLTFSPNTARYRGSLKLAGLGCQVTANLDLRILGHPHLEALHEATHHTATLGIRDGDAGVYVDKIETQDYGIKLFSEVGKRFPLHCTAMGKSLLAFARKEDRERFLTLPLEAITSKTIVDPVKLREELATVRKEGFALDREEITRGVICVAAPIFGSPDDVVGAVSIAFPSYICSDRSIETEIEAVRRQAAAISGALVRGQGDKAA
ncbi:IclR family transcriptional regulator [Shumkonia mesophila]|uniref:IclR family transcriptional regulator n=1 Tax=Shumkonia mesophila TaxID=2838854 RepID=UPI002934F721|nr:IclR family transcriptional regulator [Shumkonia mesophila]